MEVRQECLIGQNFLKEIEHAATDQQYGFDFGRSHPVAIDAQGDADMARLWEDMTVEQKFEWLRHEDQSTRQVIAGMSARLDEVGGVVVELEKQIRQLQAGIARQKGQPRRTLKLEKDARGGK